MACLTISDVSGINTITVTGVPTGEVPYLVDVIEEFLVNNCGNPKGSQHREDPW